MYGNLKSDHITLGSVLFLLWSGLSCLFKPTNSAPRSDTKTTRRASNCIHTTIITTLSFSFLNPSTYLNTLVIIGSKSLFFPVEQRIIFGIGAILASTFWFFTLVYGASKLSPIFRLQGVWRGLDIISGCIMLGIAATIIAAPYLAS